VIFNLKFLKRISNFYCSIIVKELKPLFLMKGLLVSLYFVLLGSFGLKVNSVFPQIKGRAMSPSSIYNIAVQYEPTTTPAGAGPESEGYPLLLLMSYFLTPLPSKTCQIASQ